MMQFIDLHAQRAAIGPERIERRIADVIERGAFIMGAEVRELEEALAAFCGARHCVTCANGTDALQLALMAIGVGPGDAVLVPSFTFAATAEVVPPLGAVPAFVEVREDDFGLDAASLERGVAAARAAGLTPRAVVPVDLFGLPPDMDAIEAIAAREGMRVICDAAQGFGARHGARVSGAMGDVATTSFFPAKPLGCYGDGGALFTDDDGIADLLRSLRVHGKGSHKYDNARIGVNSRLDTIQAAILLEKLAVFPAELEARQRVAARYEALLGNRVRTPRVPKGRMSSWAQYTLTLRDGTDRDALQAAMKSGGVPTTVYYPRPLHTQGPYADFPRDPAGLGTSEALAARVLSLPMHPYLAGADQEHVAETLLGALKAQGAA